MNPEGITNTRRLRCWDQFDSTTQWILEPGTIQPVVIEIDTFIVSR
jgi:hypothetical protein